MHVRVGEGGQQGSGPRSTSGALAQGSGRTLPFASRVTMVPS